jgi:hypothetical protein
MSGAVSQEIALFLFLDGSDLRPYRTSDASVFGYVLTLRYDGVLRTEKLAAVAA